MTDLTLVPLDAAFVYHAFKTDPGFLGGPAVDLDPLQPDGATFPSHRQERICLRLRTLPQKNPPK